MLASTPAPRCSPAGRRWGRCSICGWRSRRCWSTSRASPSWRPSREDANAVTIGATVTHAADRGRPRPRSDRRLPRPRRPRHRLSRRAHARHHRRQPRPRRPRRRLALLPRRRSAPRSIVAGAAGSRRNVPLAAFVRGAMDTELAEDELLVAVRIPEVFARGALRLPQDLPQDRRVRRRHRRRRARSRPRQLPRLAASTAPARPIVDRRRGSALDRGTARRGRPAAAARAGGPHRRRLRPQAARRRRPARHRPGARAMTRIALTVNGKAVEAESPRARTSPTSCASSCCSPARTSAASTASAAPARSRSTARSPAPASPTRWPATAPSAHHRGLRRRRRRWPACARPSPRRTRCSAATARPAC